MYLSFIFLFTGNFLKLSSFPKHILKSLCKETDVLINHQGWGVGNAEESFIWGGTIPRSKPIPFFDRKGNPFIYPGVLHNMKLKAKIQKAKD